MRSEVLKGHVDLLVLATLERGPLHGYGPVEELRDVSEGAFDLAEGTIYPALYRLEAAGLPWPMGQDHAGHDCGPLGRAGWVA